jgi:RNA polymerase sigma-70 factor (ECF subfamily)
VDAFADRDLREELVRLYPDLLAHARRRLWNTEDAEDATQEALARALAAVDRFGGAGNVSAWAHQIVRNVCNDEGRRRVRRDVATARAAAQAPSWTPPPEPSTERMDSLLAGLSPTSRDVLVLRYVHDQPFSFIGEAVGLSEAATRVRHHRAKQALQRRHVG